MISPTHLRQYVIEPTLRHLDLYSEPAALLMLETACQESGCGKWLHQIEGPARGVWQIEKDTSNRVLIWLNDSGRADLQRKVSVLLMPCTTNYIDEMHGNLYYACAIARCLYRSVNPPIPTTREGRAEYWSKFYNRNPKHSPSEYLASCARILGA